MDKILVQYVKKFHETVPTYMLPNEVIESEIRKALDNNRKVDWERLVKRHTRGLPADVLY